MSGPPNDSGAWVPGYVPPLHAWLRQHMRVGVAGAKLDWADIYREFVHGWRDPPPPDKVAAALTWLCKRHGLVVQVEGRHVYCLDCALS